MFLENDYARPLFDFDSGGKAKAFQCRCMKEHGYHCDHPDCTPCNKVTRTERGMRMHLKTVHNWTEQPCLYSTDHLKDQNSGAPRKLRAGPPNLKPESDPVKDTEKTPLSRKSPETKEGELLKLMNEEK